MSWSLDAFEAAMFAAGLMARAPIIADGRLHRFQVDGDKAGSKSGWYVFYDDGFPAGAFGCWKRGISETWCKKAEVAMTDAEHGAFRRRMEEVRKARETDSATRKKKAAEKALAIWKAAPLAPGNHPYLAQKHVRNHGLRLHKGALVVPLCDGGSVLHSLQFIDAEGEKRFLSGGRIAGCYYPIGIPSGTLCICEGYATGASVHEATGHAVAVAFNCGNLLSVAQAMRQKFATAKIIICADNDTHTEGNPGVAKAKAAAQAIGGFIAVAGDFV